MLPITITFICIIFVALHLLELWPLPIPFMVLVQASTTLWFLAELSFFIYFRNHVRNMQWHTELPECTPKTPAERLHVLRQMLKATDMDEVGDMKGFPDFLAGWFFGAPVENICRGNFIQWLAWSLWYKYPNQLSLVEKYEVNGLISYVEQKSGHTFPPGLDLNIKCIRLTLDPLKAIHRPFIIYAITSIFNSLARVVLNLQGFKRMSMGGFKYWYRPALENVQRSSDRFSDSDSDDEERVRDDKYPMVFFHGLGHGLVSYLHFLRTIRERSLFLMELPHISTRVWEKIPAPNDTCHAVETILAEHNYNKAIFMGHSFGTFNVSWMVKYRPELVKAVLIIDPVSLLLCLPKVAYEFCYSTATNFSAVLRRLWVARELGISRTMFRHFWWQSNAMWLDDIPYFKDHSWPASQSSQYKIPITPAPSNRLESSSANINTDKNYRYKSLQSLTPRQRLHGDVEETPVHYYHGPCYAELRNTRDCKTRRKRDCNRRRRKDHHEHELTSYDFQSLERIESEVGSFDDIENKESSLWRASTRPYTCGDIWSFVRMVLVYASGSFLIQWYWDSVKPVARTPRYSDDEDYEAKKASEVDSKQSIPSMPISPSKKRKYEKCKMAVVLSGRDTLVPSPQIVRHIALYTGFDAHVRVLYFPYHLHAQFLASPRAQRDIFKIITWLDT